MKSTMIEHFSWFNASNGTTVEIDLTGSTYFKKEDYENGQFKRYYSEGDKGILWFFEGEKISILKAGFRITGLPSPNLNYVVAVFFDKSQNYPDPNNAYIFNPDGSIYKELTMPKLVSDLSNTHYRSLKYPLGIWFNNVWRKLSPSTNQNVISMTLGFFPHWYEERVLDVETGEFGECIGSGRL